MIDSVNRMNKVLKEINILSLINIKKFRKHTKTQENWARTFIKYAQNYPIYTINTKVLDEVCNEYSQYKNRRRKPNDKHTLPKRPNTTRLTKRVK